MISTQVLIVLYNVLVNKQQLPKPLASQIIEGLTLWQVVDSDVALVRAAIKRTTAPSLSIWDAMIVEAAQRAQANTLFSEDMGDGEKFGTATIMNPFT